MFIFGLTVSLYHAENFSSTMRRQSFEKKIPANGKHLQEEDSFSLSKMNIRSQKIVACGVYGDNGHL